MTRFHNYIKQIDDISEKNKAVVISIILIVCTYFIYFQTRNHDFLNFDDTIYVTENTHVLSGLTPAGIKWAFTLSDDSKIYWHPLTWISHMTDVELWEDDAGGHHLSNLFLHGINSVLLFLVLRGMTDSLWKSAFAASIFSFHPVNVDTVAWVAERKNLLSTFFWLIVMIAYSRYTRHPSLVRYLYVVAGFIMGLLAKPMLITLPFVLLLLDYWPLHRITFNHESRTESKRPHRSIVYDLGILLKSRVIYEKIPLVLISFLSVFLCTVSLEQSGNIITSELPPMGVRIGNALVSFIAYIGKVIWPYNLAIYYPFPESIPLWQSMGACALIVLVSSSLCILSRRHPHLFVGWFWYIGTLIPVSGLYQAGLWPALADRWMYVPGIGLWIMIAWAVPGLFEKFRIKKHWMFAFAGATLLVLMLSSWIQVRHWENSETLFEHAISVTEHNDIAHFYLALAFMEKGDHERAIQHCHEILTITPKYSHIVYNLMGQLYKRMWDMPKAIRYYSKAIQTDPEYADAYNSLGVAYMYQNKYDSAIQMFAKVLEMSPKHASAYVNMGICMESEGRLNEAVHYYTNALNIKSDLSEAHYNLGNTLLKQGKTVEAIEHLRKVSGTDPNYGDAQVKLKQLMSE